MKECLLDVVYFNLILFSFLSTKEFLSENVLNANFEPVSSSWREQLILNSTLDYFTIWLQNFLATSPGLAATVTAVMSE